MARIKPWTYVLEPVDYKDTLPPLHTVEVPLTMPMQVYNDMKRHYMIETRDTVISAATAAAVTTKLQQIAAGFAYSNYGDTLNISTHKLDALENIFDENQKAPTLVWYQFKAQLAALKARFPRCEELVNSDTIDRWNAGLIPMLAVHPASAGHGLNLQGQSRMVWLSLPWSLELYEQAIGRLHRSGQRHDVWNYVLLTQKTVDETIFTALQNKRSVSDIAMECLK
jgi:hypothetical protein